MDLISLHTPEAIQPQKLASIIGRSINRNYEEVINERPCSLTKPKTTKKYVKHGGVTLYILLYICLVYYSNYHRFVSHWGFGQSIVKAISICFNIGGGLQCMHKLKEN